MTSDSPFLGWVPARCLLGLSGACLALVLIVACNKHVAPEIELVLGPEAAHRFAPTVGYAEYYQLADGSDRLRVTVASYAADCAKFVPVPEGTVSVTLSLSSPMGQPILTGEYPVLGSPDLGKADLGKATRGRLGQGSSFVRLHSDSRVVHSPGGITLQKLEPRQHGLVEGVVHQVPIAGENQVALTGAFRVRICRAVLDESRKKEP
jgi:hypothetical protein